MSSQDKSRLPLPVERALSKLGGDLSLARRRRHLAQDSMAERIGCSVATLRRLERGDHRISIGTVARALFVLGELEKIPRLLDTSNDALGLSLMDAQLPQRIRKKKAGPRDGGL